VILEAIKAGDVARVRDLVGLPGVDVNARGSISIVSNDEDAAEVTPLMAAAALGQVEIVDFLLADPRIQVNYALPVGATALSWACQHCQSSTAMALLRHPDIIVTTPNENGDTPLMLASSNGLGDVIFELLARPEIVCNINVQNKRGLSALHHAAESDSPASIDTLLACSGLDVNLRDADGDTALMAACLRGLKDVVVELLTRPEITRNINLQNSDGQSALHYASQRTCSQTHEIIDALVACIGIDVNLRDKSGNTALIETCRVGNLASVLYLVGRSDVDLMAQTRYFGWTAFHIASEYGHHDVVRTLVDYFDVNHLTLIGETAMHRACIQGHLDTVHTLLQCKSLDLTIRSEDGDTVFHRACESGSVEVVRMLMDCPSVALNAHNYSEGKTAFHLACQYGYIDVVQIHLDCIDIDIGIADKNGITGCMMALCNKKYDVACACYSSGRVEVDNAQTKDGKLLLDCLAPYLTHDVAMKLLLLDLPVEIRDKELVPRTSHLFSWTSFLDATGPISSELRLSCVKAIFSHPNFASHANEFVHELVYTKDKHDREVIQITDGATRDLLYNLVYFCGRYQIFDGAPVHISSTAVVVLAYDHGICSQLFHQHANESGELNEVGFVACSRVLGRLSVDQGSAIKKKQTDDTKLWQREFELWDKDNSGQLSKDEFLRYCRQYFGGKLKVAMKFMRNADEYEREITNRQTLDSKFVLSFLPSKLPSMADLASLQIHGQRSMVQYPHVLVMPAADRSLEDIYLKERPGDNETRSLLQQVAEGLANLHQHGIVHGDVKKLNVVRVHDHLRLIDLDAATPMDDPIGAKFSSGSLPPEMFYHLQSTSEEDAFCNHWRREQEAESELWCKIKPRQGYVVKTFQNEGGILPFELVRASAAVDVWAFGVLMYQMYSGEELVPTNINQDVLDDKIQKAATWTQDALIQRIRSKVSNQVASDLIEKLLVVTPENRLNMASVLQHAYFKVEKTGSMRIELKLDAIADRMATKDQVAAIATDVQQITRQLDTLVDMSKEGLKQLAANKQDIMRGIFEATEVTIPTSFVILPVDLTEPLDLDDAEGVLEDYITQICQGCRDTVKLGKVFMQAVNKGEPFVPRGKSMYLYLMDEVEGVPVVPPRLERGEVRSSVYPIRIETQSVDFAQFVSVAMPYAEAGLKLLQGANTVLKLAECIGIPNVTNDVLEFAVKQIDAAKRTSSVVDFDVVQSAIQAESDAPVPIQQIRGAALRELGRFFDEFDKDKDYAGLARTYAVNGQALWTTKARIEDIERTARPSKGGATKFKASTTAGKKNVEQIYLDLFQQETPSAVQVQSSSKGLTARVKEPDVERPCCQVM
ncbi:hypothetical protein As57867_000548, partial [Aphanomyces stellatus]